MQPKLFAETMEGPTVEWMVEQAALHKIILTGSIIIEEDHKFYNRLLWVLPTGQVAY
jgi:predicted amidohydrolase